MGGRNTKYKENGVTSKPKSIPPPKLPSKTKLQLVKDVNVFRDIDNHALKASWSAERTVDDLCKYLIRTAKSDLEKVRALYRWITDRISYDTTPNFHQKKIPTDSQAVLRTKKTVCIGYSNLFKDLCEKADITVKIISGYSKGRNYKPDFEFSTDMETDHAWNAVILSGNWYLIDCTWGAGSLDEFGMFKKNFSEFQFLTNPKHFVVSHFPYMDDDLEGSAKWQLLKKPLDLSTFSKRLKGMSYLYDWKIKPTSHREGVVKFQNSLDITLRYGKNSQVLIMCRLFDNRGQNCDQYTAITRRGSDRFIVRVAPAKDGEYKLSLFGRNDPNVSEMLPLTTYALNCTAAGKNVMPFPKHTGVWGPYEDYIDSGFHKSVCSNPEIEARNGQIHLKLKTTKKVDAMVKMEHASVRIDENRNYAIMEKHNDVLHVNVRLPEPGYYKVSIFTKNENQSTYSPRLCYLGHCKESSASKQPFPKMYQQSNQFSCHLIEPRDAEIPANTDVKFRFSSAAVVQAIVCEKRMKRSGKVWEATVKTPGPLNKIHISGNDKEGDNYFRLFEFSVI